MKVLNAIFVFILVVSVVSCKSDDDGDARFNLTNANIAGTYDLTYFTLNQSITGTVGGVPFTVTTNTTADTYQVKAVFTEAGTYSISGLFRTITQSSTGTPAQEQIISIDNSGTYQVNDTSRTLVLIGDGLNTNMGAVNSVTLFNENELRYTFGETFTEDDESVDSMSEFRFVRE